MRTLLLLLALACPHAQAAPASQLAADLSDLSRFSGRSFPDAGLIRQALRDYPERFGKGGASFESELHFVGSPDQTANGSVYHASALMRGTDGKYFYRKFDLTVGGTPRRAKRLEIPADIPLSEMHFTVLGSLLDRMVLVEDAAHGVQLLFPLGVGGVDEAAMGDKYRLVTPKFSGASLDRKKVNPARSEPTYYRNRPFMPITNAKGTVTAIAFHITILGDQEAEERGLNYLVRGFESHGCMRMREKDLMELFTIVMNGADEKIPVNIDNYLPPRADGSQLAHPHPVNTESYMRVTYFPDVTPHYKRDEVEHLVIMDRAQGQPDMKKLAEGALRNAADVEGEEDDADLMFAPAN